VGRDNENLIETSREIARRVLGKRVDVSSAKATVVGSTVCFETSEMEGLNGVLLIEAPDLPGRQIRICEPGDLPTVGGNA